LILPFFLKYIFIKKFYIDNLLPLKSYIIYIIYNLYNFLFLFFFIIKIFYFFPAYTALGFNLNIPPPQEQWEYWGSRTQTSFFIKADLSLLDDLTWCVLALASLTCVLLLRILLILLLRVFLQFVVFPFWSKTNII